MADDEEDFSDIESGGEEEAGDDDDPYADSGEVIDSVKIKVGKDRRYLAVLTNPELSRIIEARASQIEAGSAIGIELGPNDRTDALSIAEQELLRGECPIYIGRPSSDGKSKEKWHSRELQIMSLGNNPPPKPPVQKIQYMTFEEIIGEHVVWPKITLNKRDEVLKMPEQKVTLVAIDQVFKNKSTSPKNKPKNKSTSSSNSDNKKKVKPKNKSTSSSNSDNKKKVKPKNKKEKVSNTSSPPVKQPSLVRRSSIKKEKSPKKVS